MAEIKSALEIALERAAALGAGEDDSRREAEAKGRALARRVLEGEAEAGELAGLEPEPARRAAGRALLEALEGNRQGALPALEAMCSQGAAKEAYEALAQAQARREKARQELDSELAQGMLADLADKGISGNAVRPNPVAHPDYDARCAAALADAKAEFKTAGAQLLRALI